MNFDRKGFYRETGIRLQLLRKRAKLTQEEVAGRLAMPRASYANIERGRRQAPADVVWRLAILFGVSVATILPEPKRETRAPTPSTMMTSFPVTTLSNLMSAALHGAGESE